MRRLTKYIVNQIGSAYMDMAKRCHYRPAAPRDGCGNIAGPTNDEQEITKYAQRWWEEEDSFNFFIGCCNSETREATIFAIEAARQMCSGTSGNETAYQLLTESLHRLRAVIENRNLGRFETPLFQTWIKGHRPGKCSNKCGPKAVSSKGFFLELLQWYRGGSYDVGTLPQCRFSFYLFAAAYLDEKLTLFEEQRALLNGYFCNRWDSCEHQDAARFEKRHREYRQKDLDEVQVYRDVELVEQRRSGEGKPPKIRFLTEAEQRGREKKVRSSAPITQGTLSEGDHHV